jgi:hypothetical protein
MYYLNVMAGPAGRELAFCDDPAHGWVRDTWANDAHGPPLPDDLGGGPEGDLMTVDSPPRRRWSAGWPRSARSCWTGPRCRCSPGVFAIFGHGNVLGLGTALQEAGDSLPTWRGQNEQGMALAAVAYARATDRRQVHGRDVVHRSGRAQHGHRGGRGPRQPLPVLLLAGDTFAGRAPDPCCSRSSTSDDPTTTVNDAFRPVSRYFDR